MKKLTRTSGSLFLGMLLMMGSAFAAVTSGASSRQNEVMEQPPVVEVVTPKQDRPQAETRRNAVWYRQMRHQMRPAESAAKATVATPVFKIGEEVVTGTKEVEAGTQVSISCTTTGTNIWYTTNGNTPLVGLSGSKYTAPITVNTAMTIKAVAYTYTDDDEEPDDESDEAQVSFTIKSTEEPVTVAKPVFKVGGMEVTDSVEMVAGTETEVSIFCATEGAKIYYTDNDKDPATYWAREEVSSGASISIFYPKTIRAIAELGNTKSEEAKIKFKEKSEEPGDEPGDDDEPGQTLFVCTFESADDFAAKWTVSDHDGDNKTWRYVTGHDTYYPGLDGSFGNGYAQSVTIYDEDNPDIETADHMMTKAAIHMPAGKAYVAFNYTLGSWNPVHLKLYYSKTPDAELSDMTLVGEVKKSEKDFDKNEEAWRDTAIALTLAEAGDYYFCFVHCSKPNEFGMNLNGLYIDNIIIGTGRYAPTPELKVEHVLLPLSSCALGTEEPVFVRLRSVGSETVTKMSLSYKVNGGPAVTEEFAVSLAPSTDTTIAFSRKADLSEAGKTYTVSVSCSVEGETDTTNNEGSARVTNFTPVETLPFVINTNEEAGQNQLGFDSEAWNYGEVVGFGNWFADPLVTRCIALKGGQTYRFSFDRKTGVDLGIMQLPESFWVVYAPAGSEDANILKFYEGDYTSGVYVHDEILVTPASDGNYYFGIVPDANCCNASLFISRMSVESVGDHDVLLSAMTTTLAKRTPARHAQTPMFNVTVVNRGLNTEKVKVTVKNGDQEVGSSEMTIKKSDTAYYSIKGNMAGIEPGEVNLHFEATMAETDANPYNNTMDWKFTVTDSLYAFDKDTTYARAMTSRYVIGHIFTLAQADSLTGLMLGWFPLEESIPFGVEIYPVMEEIGHTDYYKMGECLFSGEFNRQAEGGYEIITIPRVGLTEGRYFIGLKRLDPTLLHVGFDEQPQGKFYMLSQGTLYPNVEYGYIALRALFGKTGTVTANDMDLMLSSQITSYPNPVSGLWTVTAYGLEIDRVEIFNISGSSVYRSAGNLGTDTWSLDMAGFKPGLYVARVYTNAGVQAIKVMVR